MIDSRCCGDCGQAFLVVHREDNCPYCQIEYPDQGQKEKAHDPLSISQLDGYIGNKISSYFNQYNLNPPIVLAWVIKILSI